MCCGVTLIVIVWPGSVCIALNRCVRVDVCCAYFCCASCVLVCWFVRANVRELLSTLARYVYLFIQFVVDGARVSVLVLRVSGHNRSRSLLRTRSLSLAGLCVAVSWLYWIVCLFDIYAS